jgi:putative nucleotidyltransferase with HDIG domain
MVSIPLDTGLFVLEGKSEVEIINYFLNLINEYDSYTAEHCYRVEKLAVKIAMRIGFSEEVLQKISTTALLHDVGKMAIPKNILCKPYKLTNVEFNIIKTHAESGYKILKGIPQLKYIAENVLYHHEKFNGMGYPTGKAGADIPLISRILTVADVYEAITADRVYRKAMPVELAINKIYDGKGTIFDPLLVDIFLELIR